ncbi:MAG: sulfatase [Planctomycetota bacterium]|jgi:arylsulfatase A-like enzyme
MRPFIAFIATGLIGASAIAAPPNVLFIAVDDLRPELHCYGATHIHSPNIDRLAATGTLFQRAYCQQAVCNPSRASIMTGLRPDTLRVWDLPTHFRDARPDAISIPQHFITHGYFAERVGKIYHTGHGNRDDKLSWSRSVRYPSAGRYSPEGTADLKRRLADAKARGIDLSNNAMRPRGLAYEAPELPDNQLTDGSNTDTAIRLMNEHKDRPFFLAVGFSNPHLPFVAPKKYWDLYDPAKIELAPNPFPAKGSPDYAMSSWGELRKYAHMPAKGPVTQQQALELRHGYYAAVSYVDAQVGRLLDELDRLGLTDNTIVALWGDHGWKLGEHGGWCKHSNVELDTNSPLIIRAPKQKAPGVTSTALIEFVDVFPTLCDLAGLPVPAGLDGRSAAALLDNPRRGFKPAAFSQYPRSRFMGYSMKTDRFRLTVWHERDNQKNIDAIELYDHQSDPGENVNVARHENYAKELARLMTLYRRQRATHPKP